MTVFPDMTSPRRTLRGASPLAWLLAFTLAVPAASLHAQTLGRGDVDIGNIERRIELIDPRSGPPGTVVRVNTEDMPVITPIRVGIGAAQAGFEAFQELLTGQEGEFDVTVEVPHWASWDRVHLFIVFDIYFRPIALSDAFHVTDERGMVRRTGRVDHRADGCSVLRDIDGVQYALVSGGDALGSIEEGTTVSLEGRILDREVCGLLNVLEVLGQRSY